jgi:hypothetical protein
MAGDRGETCRMDPSPKNSGRPAASKRVDGNRNGIALDAIRCSGVMT